MNNTNKQSDDLDIFYLEGLNFLDKTCLKTFYIKYFKYIFWYSAILFGLLHMFNYQGNYLIILSLSPILCFPQIVMGFILGYIRMNYGFVYGKRVAAMLPFVLYVFVLFDAIEPMDISIF